MSGSDSSCDAGTVRGGRWSVAQVGLLAISLLEVAKATVALVAGAGFSAGHHAVVRVLWMDYNGWHAVAGLLLFGPGIVFALRRSWAIAYLLVASVLGVVPGVWALFTPHVLLLLMPHHVTSGVVHLVTAAVMIMIALVQLRLDARTNHAPEQAGR